MGAWFGRWVVLRQSEGLTERINEPPWGRCLQGAVDVRWVVVVLLSSSPHRGSGLTSSRVLGSTVTLLRTTKFQSKVLTDRKNTIQSPPGPQKYNPKSSRGDPGRSGAILGAIRGDPRGDPGRSGAIRGDPGRSKAIRGDPGRSGAIRGDPGRSGAIQGDPGRSGAIRGHPGRSGDTLGYPGIP